jgi:hypothetical protein
MYRLFRSLMFICILMIGVRRGNLAEIRLGADLRKKLGVRIE